MKLRGRLTTHFLLRVILLIVTIFALSIGVNLLMFEDTWRGVSHVDLLESIEQHTLVENGRAQVDASQLAAIDEQGGWLQILDRDGREIYSYHRPPSFPTRISPGELMILKQSPPETGWNLYTWYEEPLTWIYAEPLKTMQQDSPYFVSRFVVVWLSISLLTVVIVALLFGRQLGKPLLHMMNWLQAIAQGRYAEPTDALGNPRSRHPKSGALRRPYRTYQEVIDALEHLTATLQRGEEERRRLDHTREEWITGVSHDLKTPLSSVKGYAELIAAPQYAWSEAEVRHFAQVILEKGGYMEELIEDLNLTFRLKNNALPLQLAPLNAVEAVRRAVIELANDPRAAEQQVAFIAPQGHSWTYPLDEKWFQRAVGNLLVNAAVHNPPGTSIEVRVEQTEDGGFLIRIADDGQGMDEETVHHLFDRYYRGTNTEDRHSAGSGLGTAIAKQLIDAHGGSISIYSRPGEGTKICIAFPAPPAQS